MKINSSLPRHHSALRVLGALLLAVALANCSTPSGPSRPEGDVQQLLDKAHTAPLETRAPYLLDAAELALQQNRSQQAERILREAGELKLRDDQRARASALRSQLLAQQNKSAQTPGAGAKKPAAQSSSNAFASGAFQPQQIALLLPQSGKLANFGDAVRDGFFAAFYAGKSGAEKLPAVRVYDTEGAGVVALYQQAVADGATLVIGPLEKNLVAQFYTQPLPVPLLALNRTDTNQPPPSNLYQLALAPEDETAALATLAARNNRSNALIIASDDDARSRELEAFTQQWQNLGGHIAGTALYRDQQSLSTVIRSALNIPRSEARGKEMESLLNRNIEFTPHRRRDIDMVFMLAKPAQARQIKPLLDFYYAGDLPIYSTSRIYAGYPIASSDRDIEKVRFTEIPFVLQSGALKQQILAANPAAKNYLRLYALGIDSFNFYPHLQQQEFAGEQRFNGQTGALWLDPQRVVQRTLPLAEMRGGTPRVIDSNGTLAEPITTDRDDNADQPDSATP